MKNSLPLSLGFLSTAFLTASLLAQIPAFPGAEGFGAHATGGRGGDVYRVTNLNPTGPGSLKEGVDTAPSSGRTIVFDVSGYISIRNGRLRIVQDNITIAGQTAPGDGIGLYDGTLRISGSNTVIRNLRLRHGKGGAGGDCLNVDASAENTIIDHVSMQFSTDENISFFNSSLDKFTMQNSLSAWGLESHNAGGLWDLDRGSCIDSLWAHHHTRNPKARPSGLMEWVNNVTFDWGIGLIMGDSQTPAPWKANVIGSYFLSPPANTDNYALEKASVDRNGNPNFSLYLNDCLHDSDGDGVLNGTDKGYAIVRGSEYQAGDPAGANRYIKSTTPFAGASGNIAVSIDDPLNAFKKVLSKSGAVRMNASYDAPLRDEVDTILFNNVANQIHSRISRESDLPVTNNGFGTLESTPPSIDTDLDGMPDYWELALGFNATTGDQNTVYTNTANTFFPIGTPSGYTRLEEYLHFLSHPHATVAKNTSAVSSDITIDLRRFTSGFTKSPSYAVSNLTSGTVQQFAANGTTPSATGPIVRFTPALNYSGRAGFNFTVSDGDGSSWEQRLGLLVTVTALPRQINWKGGANGNAWDTTTDNWQTSAGATTAFNDGDNTLFDDRGNNATIPISGNRSPNSVTLTGSKDYRFAGPGSLTTTTTFTKSSDTTLNLNTNVTAAGGSFLNGGVTNLNEPARLDGGDIRFTGGATLNVNHGSGSYFSINPDIFVDEGATGNINLSQRANLNGSFAGGGTFNVFSPSNLGTEGRVYFNGNSSGCTGSINLSGGGSGRIAFISNGGAFDGFPNGRLHLDGITIYTRNNSFGNTYSLGSLSGTSNATIIGPYFAGTATWNVGALGLDSEFAGVIRNGTGGQENFLNKFGSGTLTLSGANTYTGTTTVHEGELRVTGSLGDTDLFVEDGATLSGTGQVASLLTAQDGAILSPGDNPGEAGTMTSGNGFELKAATLKFDLSADPATGNDRIINQNGTLTLRSPGGNLGANFEFNLIDGSLSPGTYHLVSGGAGTAAPGSPAFAHNLPNLTRQSFSLQRSGGGSSDAFVRLVVGGSSSDLTWTGSSTIWNLNGASPWSGGAGGDNRFYNLDRVNFTDSAATGIVNLTEPLQPQTVSVSANSRAYNFIGSGTLTGTSELFKSGNATLTLSNNAPHTFSGGTTINGGTLALGNSTVGLGSGLITLNGGTLSLPNSSTFLDNSLHLAADSTIRSNYNGNSTVADSFDATLTSTGFPTLNLAGINGILSFKGSMSAFAGKIDFGNGSGMLRLNSGSNAEQDVNFGSPSTHFALGTGGATLTNRNGDKEIDLGALSGGPGTHLNGRQSGSGNTTTTYRIGALNLDTCFDGTISHSNDLSGLELVKVGTGSLCLGGTSDFLGSISIESGTLAIPGSVTTNGATDVFSGATLDLMGGTIATESLNVASGAILRGPGTIEGELSNSGTITCSSGGLAITGPVVNDGVIIISSPATFSATDSFANNGTLDLLTSGGSVPANLINNGIVIFPGDLQLTSFTRVGNLATLKILSHSGHHYQLQTSSTLEASNWTNIGTNRAGNGTELTFSHSASDAPRFYRIVVTP